MKYTINIFKAVYRDVKRIQSYYDKLNPSTGAKIADKITAAIHSLDTMPLRYPVYQAAPKYRRMVVGRFLVFYVVLEEKNEVQIHRVYDGRMDVEKRLRQ